MSESNELSRRNFMQIAIWGMGGIIGLGYTVAAVSYVIKPSLKTQQTQTWIRLGPTSKVELGVPTLFTASVETQTGWISSTQEISTYILSTDGRTYIAMSNICTHLGCHVRWITEQDHFLCPCHNGVFDSTGKVVSGPPPRPLDRYDVKVENDQLYILVGG
jgi:menaquinol-cytochrome c reductase iron-sulfur subunit